jgi:hypothetical protein
VTALSDRCPVGISHLQRLPARSIDILSEITGVDFPDAWKKRVASTFFGVPVHFISLDDLVTNKRALGRSSDLKDLQQKPKTAKPKK